MKQHGPTQKFSPSLFLFVDSAISCSKLTLHSEESNDETGGDPKILSMSAPASTNCLLGNFEVKMWLLNCFERQKYVQYAPRGFPTFRKTPRKIFRAENLSVFPMSVFLGVFSISPPRTFYRPS